MSPGYQAGLPLQHRQVRCVGGVVRRSAQTMVVGQHLMFGRQDARNQWQGPDVPRSSAIDSKSVPHGCHGQGTRHVSICLCKLAAGLRNRTSRKSAGEEKLRRNWGQVRPMSSAKSSACSARFRVESAHRKGDDFVELNQVSDGLDEMWQRM